MFNIIKFDTGEGFFGSGNVSHEWMKLRNYECGIGGILAMWRQGKYFENWWEKPVIYLQSVRRSRNQGGGIGAWPLQTQFLTPLSIDLLFYINLSWNSVFVLVSLVCFLQHGHVYSEELLSSSWQYPVCFTLFAPPLLPIPRTNCPLYLIVMLLLFNLNS